MTLINVRPAPRLTRIVDRFGEVLLGAGESHQERSRPAPGPS